MDEQFEVTMSIYDELNRIQQELAAPKGQFNDFSKYHYRSCEDILAAVKPLLNRCVLLLNDEIVLVGDRYYIKATATLSNGANQISATAYARESLDKRGMDESQITGSASSYARKYALNALLCIDDTKDADTKDNAKWFDDVMFEKQRENMITALQNGERTHAQIIENIKKTFSITKAIETKIKELK